MMADFRALCAELLDWAEVTAAHYIQLPAVMLRARAALADGPAVPEGREPASVTGQPSDQQLLEVMPQQFHDDLATVSRMAAHGAGPDVDPGLFRVSLNTGVVDFARAVLARWGNPMPVPLTDGEVDCISIDEMCEILRFLGIKAAEYTDCTILYELTFEQLRAICDTRAFALSRRTPAAPADGEVAELVAWLREIGDTIQPSHLAEHQRYKRAAELLQRQAPVPVPVAVTGQPSDEELARLWFETDGRAVLGAKEYARAVLARWGNAAPQPPAEGEVAELVADQPAFASWLAREMPPGTIIGDPHWWAPRIARRAAKLLQRQALVPVSVSERLPGPEVCVPHPRTKRGNWCWGFERCEVSLARPARWRLMHMETVEMEASHWLPAHALPIPHQQENAND